METAKQVYRQTLPDDVPDVIRCKGCGYKMKQVFKNDKVVFWAHWGQYHKYHDGCPLKLAYRTSYLRDLIPFMEDKFHVGGEQKSDSEN